MTFDETRPLSSLQAAQLSGVRRLLKDNGYKIESIFSGPDKTTGQALAAFRNAMKFPPNAGNAELFTALEDGARHRVAPAGVTACNDGKVPLLIALAQIVPGKQTSRGWWTVAPAACALLQSRPLAPGHIYILARTQDGTTVVGGDKAFCISLGAFEFENVRDHCREHGNSLSGFAPIEIHNPSAVVLYLGGRNRQVHD